MAAFLAAFPVHAAQKPNVIIFLADDLGYADLACHGNAFVKTPQLDAFAREAVEFTQFRVSPMCSPTRASLMTGRYNFRGGVYTTLDPGCNLDPGETTLADCMKRAGYKTGLFGKWHLGFGEGERPNQRGFDETLTFSTWAGAGLKPSYFDPTLLHNGKPEKHPGYCMDIFTDAAIRFIRENQSRPFFIYLPANLIHEPLQVDPELCAGFGALSPNTQKIYGMIRSVDNSFGRLRAALKELNLEQNTIVVFTSDNGASVPVERYMGGLRGIKGTPYENGLRVPLFVRWPAGVQSPATVAASAAHIDLFPTILDACGIERPGGLALDGSSLMPLLRNPAAPWPSRALVFQQSFAGKPRRGEEFAVLDLPWKLVQPCGTKRWGEGIYRNVCRTHNQPDDALTGPPRYELFNILDDPGETKNLAAAHPEMVERMKRQYDAWFSDVAARWPECVAAAEPTTVKTPAQSIQSLPQKDQYR